MIREIQDWYQSDLHDLSFSCSCKCPSKIDGQVQLNHIFVRGDNQSNHEHTHVVCHCKQMWHRAFRSTPSICVQCNHCDGRKANLRAGCISPDMVGLVSREDNGSEFLDSNRLINAYDLVRSTCMAVPASLVTVSRDDSFDRAGLMTGKVMIQSRVVGSDMVVSDCNVEVGPWS